MPSPVTAPSPPAALTLASVAHNYRVRGASVPALTPVDLRIEPGEFVSLIGPSGCGKSTLLRIAGGMLVPSAGNVQIDGGAVRDAQRHKRLGFVSQDAALLPWRTAHGNVRVALEMNRHGAIDDGAVDEALGLVGMDEFAGYYPHQLSGGMKQRVALARALVLNPALLLMDEPFGALDDLTRADLRHELGRLRDRIASTVLFVTHGISEAVLLSDRVLVMTGPPGRITESVAIDLPRRRAASLEEAPEFLVLTQRLRSALRRT